MRAPAAVYLVWSGLVKRNLEPTDFFVCQRRANRAAVNRNSMPILSGATDWVVTPFYKGLDQPK